LRGGQTAKKDHSKDKPNDRADWVIVPGAHEALVSQELFERVQNRLRANRGGRGPRVGSYLFSGLLTCSHCGRRLSGFTPRHGRIYRCHRTEDGARVVCGYRSVREDVLLQIFADVIQRQFLDPARLAALRAEIIRQEQAERSPTVLSDLRKQLNDLEANIDRGNGNLLLLPPDRLPGAIAQLRNWEAERDRVQAELAGRMASQPAMDLDRMVKACTDLLWRLREAIAQADKQDLWDLVHEAIARIELRWEWRKTPCRNRYILAGGVIHLRADLGAAAGPGVTCAQHGKPWSSTTS
jgi:hypothetical protein